MSEVTHEPPKIGGPQPQVEEQTVEVPIHQVQIRTASFNVQTLPDGNRLVKIGPIVFELMFVASPDEARDFARSMTGGIELASSIVPARRI